MGGGENLAQGRALSAEQVRGSVGQKVQTGLDAREDTGLEEEEEERDEERRRQWQEEDEEEEAVRAATRRTHEELETAPELSKGELWAMLAVQYEQALKQVGVVVSSYGTGYGRRAP